VLGLDRQRHDECLLVPELVGDALVRVRQLDAHIPQASGSTWVLRVAARRRFLDLGKVLAAYTLELLAHESEREYVLEQCQSHCLA